MDLHISLTIQPMANHFSIKARKSLKLLKLNTFYTEYLHGVSIAHVEDAGITYKRFDKIAFLDWDWPNVSHRNNDCVTIQNFGEVVDLLEPWLHKHPSFAIRLYETPGGVRGIFTSHFMTVNELVALGIEELNSDPMYIKLSLQRGVFGARISPKLNRTGDFIARYVCTLGVQQDVQILDILSKFHDNYLL
jgi:hypothetical protein